MAIFCPDRHLHRITLRKKREGLESAGKLSYARQRLGLMSVDAHIRGKTRAVNPLHADYDIRFLKGPLCIVANLDDQVLTRAKLAAFIARAVFRTTLCMVSP